MEYSEMKDKIDQIKKDLQKLQLELDDKNNEAIADEIDQLYKPLRKIKARIVEAKIAEKLNR